MKIKSICSFFSALVGLGLAGCAHKTDFPTPEAQRASLAATTIGTINSDYAAERSNGKIPRIGLALSGGGTRAGMFAHGVLHGLNEAVVLPYVDIVSSVSGGGYAAYWYYARRLEAQKANFNYKDVFADCRPDWWTPVEKNGDDRLATIMQKGGTGNIPLAKLPPCKLGAHEQQAWAPTDPFRWQAHLARQADLLRPSPVVFNGKTAGGPWLEGTSLLLGSLFEVVFSPFISEGALGGAYEEGIARTWGLSPVPRSSPTQEFEFKDAEKNERGYSRPKAGVHTWEALRSFPIKDGIDPLPLWIINTTVLTNKGVPNEDAIFEITPVAYGSRASGFISTSSTGDLLPELVRAVRASAAAADPQGFRWKSEWRGEFIGRSIPALEWGVTIPKEKNPFLKHDSSFRLSDGGQSDNLGLISLVRRGVEDIILMDGEADPSGTFNGLCWDWTMLNSAGYEMQFGALQDFAEFCRGEEEYRKRIAANESDPEGWQRRAYNVSDWKNPVVEGKIWKRGFDGGVSADFPSIRVWLIKLGWDQDQVQQSLNERRCEEVEPQSESQKYPNSCLLTVFRAHQVADKDNGDYLVFPQLTTAGATFNASTPLMWAYRELGRQAAAQLAISSDRIARRTDRGWPTVSRQKLLCFSDEGRAVECVATQK